MNTCLFARFGGCGLFFSLLIIPIQAEDLATRSGKTLKNVQVIELGSDFVVMKHSGGTEKISMNDLPAPWQKRLSAPVLFEELKRKEQELEKLRGELSKAHGETQTLKRETQTLQQEKQDLATAANKAGVNLPPRKPVPPIASLPPLHADTVVSAEDLADQFHADAQGAEQRYRGKTFQVKGAVDHFNSRMFVRNYDVILETADRRSRVICNFPYEDQFKAVYSKDSGQRLVGNSSRRGEVTLLKTGVEVKIKGRCAGLKDNQVVLGDCELVK